jgi:hypothetical protein
MRQQRVSDKQESQKKPKDAAIDNQMCSSYLVTWAVIYQIADNSKAISEIGWTGQYIGTPVIKNQEQGEVYVGTRETDQE